MTTPGDDPVSQMIDNLTPPPDVDRLQGNIASSQSSRGSTEASLEGNPDPSYITSMEHFGGLPHSQIYANAQAMLPGVINETAQAWNKIHDSLMFGGELHHSKVRAKIAEGWEGKAAEAATAASERFANELRRTSNVFFAVSRRLTEVSQAAEVVKGSVPPPPNLTPGQVVPGLGSAADIAAGEQAKQEAWREAIRVMETSYVPTYQPAGDNVPGFTAPTGGATDVGSGGGAGGGSTGGGSSNASGGTGGGSAGTGEHGTGTQTAGQPGPDQPGATQAAGLGETPGAGQGSTTGGTTSTPSTTPASVGGASTAPAAAGGFGSAGIGGGVGGGGVGGGGSSGSSRGPSGTPSLGGPTTGAPAAPGATGATGGRAGTAGPGGMMPPGGRRTEDEENEHKTPDWLVNEDNGNELIGPMRRTAPPVLGADDEVER